MAPNSRHRLSPFWTAQIMGWGTYALAKSVLSPTAYPAAWRVILLVGLGLVLSLPLRALYRRRRAGPLSQPVIIGLAVVASAGTRMHTGPDRIFRISGREPAVALEGPGAGPAQWNHLRPYRKTFPARSDRG
jgi:hypothetical protein